MLAIRLGCWPRAPSLMMHRQDKQELEPSEGPSIAERRAERKARAAAEVAAREEQERKVRHALLPCSAELLES